MTKADRRADSLQRENEALRAELRKLSGSDAFNRTLIASIPHKIFLKDRRSIYLTVNEVYAANLGCKPEDLVGKDDFALFPAELAEKYRADDKTVMESGRLMQFDEEYVAQGQASWVQTTKAPVTNDSGEVTGVLGLFEDVTARKRAMMALEASEIRYRRLFESAKDGILILDGDTGLVVDVNPYLIALTGHAREELLGKRLWELGAFKDIAASIESFTKLQWEGYVRYDDLPLRARDGRRIDVEFISNVYPVGEKRVIQCNIRDIRARKGEENERVRLNLAMEQTGEIVVITDTAGDIAYVNPAFEAVTGYARAEVVGKNPRFLKSGVQDGDFYREMWTTLLSGKTWAGRLVNRKKDGTRYTEEATISPVRDAAGVITSYVAVKRDITSLLELEAQFLHAQKMDGVGRLAGGVAHDFNNLVTVIMSHAEFALESLREGDPLRGDLLEVQHAGKRAAALTRQLLAFSRKQVLQPEPLDLNQTLTDMDNMLRRIIGEDIEITWAQAPDLGLVMADRGQLDQVLMNLVLNARDAMVGGGKLTIGTANAELDGEYAAHHVGATPGPYVMLTVSDTGCGMDEATRRQVFDPFFTTKETGKGTGLGLSTVFGIVQQSGGTVWVNSEPGLGTTFKVYLPRAATESVAPAVAPSDAPTRSRGHETILVVEDEAALRKVVRRTLEAAGYAVITAVSGTEAMAAFSRDAGTIELVLTDIVMPEMSGEALVRELAKTGATARILYMSGYSGDALLNRGVLAPGTHFLAKPFTPADLARKVRAVLDADGAG